MPINNKLRTYNIVFLRPTCAPQMYQLQKRITKHHIYNAHEQDQIITTVDIERVE